jgi:hypothetical protein
VTADAVVEGALAFIGAVALSVALSIAFYEFVLRPLTRHLDRRSARRAAPRSVRCPACGAEPGVNCGPKFLDPPRWLDHAPGDSHPTVETVDLMLAQVERDKGTAYWDTDPHRAWLAGAEAWLSSLRDWLG